jgi:hypothetical protein
MNQYPPGGENSANNEATDGCMTRIVRVVAWVEIMGNRAETTFTVESPWVCEGACPVLQQDIDRSIAAWVFSSHAKSGFTVFPISNHNAELYQPDV